MPSIELTEEEEATLMYQSLANSRERGEQLHASIECLIDMCDTPEKLLMGYRVSRRPVGKKSVRPHAAKKSNVQEFTSDEDFGIFTGGETPTIQA